MKRQNMERQNFIIILCSVSHRSVFGIQHDRAHLPSRQGATVFPPRKNKDAFFPLLNFSYFCLLCGGFKENVAKKEKIISVEILLML